MLEVRRLLSTVTVTTVNDVVATDGQTSLREAVAQANPGDTIAFAPGAVGIFTLSGGQITLSKNVTIEGRGTSATWISAGGASRIFDVESGVTAALRSMTLSDGFVTATGNASGGAVRNAGTLTMEGVTLSNSTAKGANATEQTLAPGNGSGGAILNTGKLTLNLCTLSNNAAVGGEGVYGLEPSVNLVGGGNGFGGAIVNSGTLTMSYTTFSGNRAMGGDGVGVTAGSDGGASQGGAIYNGGTLTMTFGGFTSNTSQGGTGGNADLQPGNGGGATGGAVFNTGTFTLNGVAFSANKALAGAGGSGDVSVGGAVPGIGAGASGGAIYTDGVLAVTGGTFSGNVAQAGPIGEANGGAIFGKAKVSVADADLSNNKAIGGSSDGFIQMQGGGAGGGAIYLYSGSLVLTGSTLAGNAAVGGQGAGTFIFHGFEAPAAGGGNATGGGILLAGPATITRSTLFGNTATGGRGGFGYDATNFPAGNGGDGLGGALYDAGGASITACTIAGNKAVGGATGEQVEPGGPATNGAGSGGGIYVVYGGPTLANTIVATNTANTGLDVRSSLVKSNGYNLIGTADGSSGWVASDKKGTNLSPLNPMLGGLADNGVPTRTMLPMSASPAIDAGKAFGLTTDQRGQQRAVDLQGFPNAAGGDGTDIGAVELQSGPTGPQAPFKSITIGNTPATIQNEDFDYGGEGVAYHDTESANLGGASARDTGVDLKVVQNDTGGLYVGYTKAGEWLEYTVNVAVAGTYKIDFRVASGGSGGKFHLEVDGANATGSLAVPNTGGWQTWKTITKTGVNLTAGTHVLRLAMESNGATGSVGNFNYFTFTKSSSPTTGATIKSTDATYVRDGGYANFKYGSESQLIVKKYPGTGYNRKAWIKFDLSSVPSIGSAKLRLFGNLGDSGIGSVNIGIFSASNAWSEGGLTWNTRPAVDGTQRGSFSVSGTTAKWYEIDLTSFLKAEKAAGHNTVTLALRSGTSTATTTNFASDETANGPQLQISA
jgi:hypothetical protein